MSHRRPPSGLQTAAIQRSMLTSPALFLRDVDPLRGTAIFTPMSEDSYRASAFLDNRVVRSGARDLIVDLDDLIDLASSREHKRRVIHYIFHIGHCGSTLVSRVLGERRHYLSLREPPLLMGLSRSLRALGRSGFPISHERWETLKDLSLMMLGKTWRDDQVALIKPTSHAANLTPILMDHTGRERAVCLYVDLESYLATMLRPHTRRETRLFAKDFRVREFSTLFTGASDKADDYSDAELAAMSWLLHARELSQAMENAGVAERCLPLHFDDFLQNPTVITGRICEFLGSPVAPSEWDRLDVDKWLCRAAKVPDQHYGGDDRNKELADSRLRHRAEMEDGMSWAAAISRSDVFNGLTVLFGPARQSRETP